MSDEDGSSFDTSYYIDDILVSDTFIPPSGGDTTPPTVSLTAPANGATFTGGTTTITANATDTESGVNRVEFYLDSTTLLGQDTTSGDGWGYSWNTSTSSNGSHALTARAYNGAGLSTTSSSVSVTVNIPPTAPSITTQPTNQSVSVGQTVTFSVVASGTTPFSYQWRRNGVNISGATSSTYTTPSLTLADNGSIYTVVVTNSVGSITSAPATLTVNPASSNLALGRPVVTSSIEEAGAEGTNAVDGNVGTRWSSSYSDPQWISIDLGSLYEINRVVLNWEVAYGQSYRIQTSSDGTNWNDIYSTTSGNGEIDDISIVASNNTGRYVRMYGTMRGTGYGYSLYEFEVYGTASGSPTSCNTVTTSNFSQSAYNAYGAPYDLFVGNAPLVDAQCTSADTHTINATIGKTGDTTRIVYTKGYYYDPGITNWTQYTGTCTGTLNGDWCAGPVTATITDPDISTASAGAPAYFVGMVCSVQGGSWKCGCRDTSCTNFSWQVQGAGM